MDGSQKERGPCPTIEEVVHSVQYGDIYGVERAIDVYHISPNTKDREDCSLLHWASINNRLDIVEFLLQRKADVNIIGGNAGEIPLQWAVRQDRCYQIVALMLEHGANVHHKSIHGYDALQLAVQSNNLHGVYLLLEAGANPNTVDTYQDTPLYNVLKEDVRLNTLDIIRLLINFGASLNHQGNGGNNALHIMANSYEFDTYCAFLICNRASEALFDAKNADNYTPFQLAWRRRNTKMIRFLFDIYMFRRFPKYLTIVVAAATFSSFFICLHYFGWLYGLVVFSVLYLLSDMLSQGSLISESSRASCGLAWGIIISATSAYYIYLTDIYGRACDVFIFALASAICYTMYRSMYTKPSSLSDNGEESRKTLAKKIVEAAPVLNGDGQVVGSSFRFCSTCLVDKTLASTHCSKCNMCVPNLDHHCPFVNNCVGKGNRRIFVFFTFFASLGCAVMSTLSFLVHRSHFCEVPGDHILTMLAVQLCMFKSHPALASITWVAASASIWIFCVFWGQITMVGAETTTYEIMKRNNHGKDCMSLRGIKNLVHFFQTGQYHLTSSSHDRCCSHDHGHNHHHESASLLSSNV